MITTPFELKQAYKKDTSKTPILFQPDARVGRYGDVIIDRYDNEEIVEYVEANKELVIYDVDYVKWLEEKVMEMIKSNSLKS